MTLSAYVIWSSTLLIILLLIVPAAWALLNKTLQHAKSIERYSSEMLEKSPPDNWDGTWSLESK